MKKVDDGTGGAGYEGMIVSSELIGNVGTAKFIPIIRQAGTHATPICVSTRAWINLSEGADVEDEFKKLVANLRKEPPATRPPRPPIPAPAPLPTPAVTPVVPASPAFDSGPSASATSAAPAAPTAQAVYHEALELARSGDLVRWRKLAAQIKGRSEQSLRDWRSPAENNLPKLKTELPAFMHRGVATQEPLFALALAGVESGAEKFRGQASLIYDLLQPKGWERSGYTLITDFPEANAFVLHALLGAMSVYSGQVDLALDLATQRVTDRDNSTVSRPLFLDHPLSAWPPALETTATTAWEFLHQLPEKFPWLVDAFGSADAYRESLSGYYLLLAWLEYLYFLRDNPDPDKTTKARLEIPPMYLRTLQFRAGLRRLLQDRKPVIAFGEKLAVPARRQIQNWPQWCEFIDQWLESVYHFPESLPTELLHLSEDLNR